MWHYGMFLPTTLTPALGTDGHPPRRDFLPDIWLPRRMFAGADIRFHTPLKVLQTAIKTSEEGQTIVYRSYGPPQPAVVPLPNIRSPVLTTNGFLMGR